MRNALLRMDFGVLRNTGDKDWPYAQVGHLMFGGLRGHESHVVRIGREAMGLKVADLQAISTLAILRATMRRCDLRSTDEISSETRIERVLDAMGLTAPRGDH